MGYPPTPPHSCSSLAQQAQAGAFDRLAAETGTARRSHAQNFDCSSVVEASMGYPPTPPQLRSSADVAQQAQATEAP